MKNKKGFVFVETIIVISVLIVSLLLIYSAFTSVLNSEKIRTHYDDTLYLYRTYYLKDFFEGNNLESIYDKLDEFDSYVQVFNCNYPNLLGDPVLLTSASEDGIVLKDTVSFCEKMLSILNVDKLYATNYEINPLKSAIRESEQLREKNDIDGLKKYSNLDLLDYGTKAYIKSSKIYGNKEESILNAYRIIATYRSKIITDKNQELCSFKNEQEECLIYDSNERNYASLMLRPRLEILTPIQVNIDVENGTIYNNKINVMPGEDFSAKIIPNPNYALKKDNISNLEVSYPDEVDSNSRIYLVGNTLYGRNVSKNTYILVKLHQLYDVKVNILYYDDESLDKTLSSQVFLNDTFTKDLKIEPNYHYIGGSCDNGVTFEIDSDTLKVKDIPSNTTCRLNYELND